MNSRKGFIAPLVAVTALTAFFLLYGKITSVNFDETPNFAFGGAEFHRAVDAKTVSKKVYGKIPKILHQTFTSSRVFTDYRKYIEGCLALNPDWQYFFWRDQDILAFISDYYPYFMRKYLIFRMHVQRGDSIRYMVLHHYGGIYVDMDVECVKPFFPSLSNLTAFVDQEAKEHAVILYGKEFSAMNSAMGSVRGHPFFQRFIFAMMQVDDAAGGAGATTGPDLLTAQLTEWQQGIATSLHEVTLLDPVIFSPIIDNGLHNFKDRCQKILKAASTQVEPGARRMKQMKEALCTRYAQRNWKHDLTSSETVGRHLFLHLGYRWGSPKTRYFEITDVNKNAQFYNTHKHAMASFGLERN